MRYIKMPEPNSVEKKFFRGYRQQSKCLSSKQSSLQKNADE